MSVINFCLQIYSEYKFITFFECAAYLIATELKISFIVLEIISLNQKKYLIETFTDISNRSTVDVQMFRKNKIGKEYRPNGLWNNK